MSPDGQMLAFTGVAADGKRLIFVRPLDFLTSQGLPGTEEAWGIFWSADSRFIGFFAGGKLKKIRASGGPAATLCDPHLSERKASHRASRPVGRRILSSNAATSR